ncbi:hypothetical protein ACFPYI_00595 [Halomarina salina]|uniref:DUF7344 domain-containing protein n=1 Tax=Halomarina salina TaxID=1872699 RepID=A0ABD5RHK0_9EURY|nr:hypothetical protein [Halomarina salina]
MSSQRLTDTPPETSSAHAEPTEVERDDAFHLLSNARRRSVMRYLLDVEGPAELGTLAEHVAALENDCDTDELSSDDRKRVYISLYQGHMPKLDNHDIVEYDQARGTVEPEPIMQAFAPYLDEDPLSLDDTDPVRSDAAESPFTSAINSILGR